MSMAKRKPTSDLPRTVAEFDAWNAAQAERWEFIGGAPVLMAPASKAHTVIKGNVFASLRAKLAGSPCRAFVDGVEVRGHDLAAIPDIVVTCGPVDFTTPSVHEPVLIVEVLSPSTASDDVGHKWQGYCLIQSLRHYLVIAQDSRFATLHTRTGAAAFAETVHQDGSIDLPALGISLSLDEIYEDVTFPGQVSDG